MLTSLVFKLRAREPVTLPRNVGSASHAAFLSAIAETDPDLADHLHRADQRRPFTCATLSGGRPRGASQLLVPDTELSLRYTSLNAEVSAHLQRMAATPPSQLQLFEATLDIIGTTLDPAIHPWDGQATCAELAAQRLLPDQTAKQQAGLHFLSPTAFRSGDEWCTCRCPNWSKAASWVVGRGSQRLLSPTDSATTPPRASGLAAAGWGRVPSPGEGTRCRSVSSNGTVSLPSTTTVIVWKCCSC